MKKACLEFGGAMHATCSYINEKISYYDANFHYPTTCLERNQIEELLKRIRDYKYIGIEKNIAECGAFEFYLYSMGSENDEPGLIFNPEELPTEEASFLLFQQNSPNQWTPLHIVVIFDDLYSFKLLLNNEEININLQDRFGQTPFNIAIQQGKEEMVLLLLNESRLFIYLSDLENACRNKQLSFLAISKMIDQLIKQGREVNKLLLLFLHSADLEGIKYLVETYRIDINQL